MQEIDPPPLADPERFTALERAQAVSRSLADAARRARFSSRARGAHQKTPFESRRGAKVMRYLRLFLFGLFVVVPNVVGLAYFGVLASDQFESEAMFTVSSGAVPKMDGLGSVTGLPPMAIVQDTQIVTNFIESRAMVERLEKEVGLREAYSSDSIDWWARFKKDKPIEKFTEYWEKMTKTSISFPAGIVKLTVRAFSAADAKRISDAIIAQCEALINSLNNRMRSDTVLAAERDLERAADKLKSARVQLEQTRNAEGLIDVRQQSATFYQILADLESDLRKAQADYQTQLGYVSEQAPQMRVSKSRIASLEAEIAKVNAQITETEQKSASTLAQKSLSGKMTAFADLELEQKIAEKRYDTAAAAVTSSRMLAERKMLYLHQIVPPALPQIARYPKRWINIGITFVASLTAWAVVVGLLHFVRNNMA
jgi:capsular polysaccharide transport system permease protein